jgi:membrane-bound lytic murein transglycosylase A
MKKYLTLLVVTLFAVVSIFVFLPVQKNVKKSTRRERRLSVKPPVTISANHLKPTDFDQLPQWQAADVQRSFKAFTNSCDVWETMNPNTRVGSQMVSLKVKDWLPICHAAKKLDNPSAEEAKGFFEDFFKPYHWRNSSSGRFTGYYSPIFKGSLKRSSTFNTPLYETPKRGIKAFSRAEIYRGALAGKAKVIAWLKNPVDAMALEIEGSGVIDLGHGKKYFVAYDNQNGHRYKSLAQMAIDLHLISRAKASIDNIRHYFSKHPEKIPSLVNRNPSFVYFTKYEDSNFSGAHQSVLVPKYSMAVDRRYIPLGMPLFLTTKHPVNTDGMIKPLNRVMIAQDTGGAIKGPIRGDIYWGAGERATQIANMMSEQGDFWLLLPRHFTG